MAASACGDNRLVKQLLGVPVDAATASNVGATVGMAASEQGGAEQLQQAAEGDDAASEARAVAYAGAGCAALSCYAPPCSAPPCSAPGRAAVWWLHAYALCGGVAGPATSLGCKHACWAVHQTLHACSPCACALLRMWQCDCALPNRLPPSSL